MVKRNGPTEIGSEVSVGRYKKATERLSKKTARREVNCLVLVNPLSATETILHTK